MGSAESQSELFLPAPRTDDCLREKLAVAEAKLAAAVTSGERVDAADDVARLRRLLGIGVKIGGGA